MIESNLCQCDNINYLSKEDLCSIFQYLSPLDKKMAALVCTLWREIAEDNVLLLDDFNHGKDLTCRQLSVLVNIPCKDLFTQHTIVLAFSSKLRYKNPPIISEKNLIHILDSFEKSGIPEEPKHGTRYKWVNHLSTLKMLEKCFRLSSDFSNEKAESIFSKHIEFMKINGFNLDEELVDQDDTPISSAVRQNCPILLEALLRSGAKVDNVREYSHEQAIHCLAGRSPMNDIDPMYAYAPELTIQCLQILIKYGANPNATERAIACTVDYRLTPMWRAAHFGSEEIIEALANVKADVNQETNHLFGDSTPIQAAAYSGHLQSVIKLIELGADPKLKNSEQESASDLARKNGHIETAVYLDGLAVKK